MRRKELWRKAEETAQEKRRKTIQIFVSTDA